MKWEHCGLSSTQTTASSKGGDRRGLTRLLPSKFEQSQKKAQRAMKAAKDRVKNTMIQLVNKTFCKDTSGVVGRTPERPNHSLGKSIKVFGESPPGLAIGSKLPVASRVGCNGLQLCGYQRCAKDVGRPVWEGVWLCLDPWDSVRLRTASTHWNVPGKNGPHGELFFFVVKKEPVVASSDVSSNSLSTPLGSRR